MKSHITLEEAIEIIDNNIQSLPSERVSLLDAVGRIAAEDIFSEISNPPFNKSAMDGYAILASDTDILGNTITIIDTVYAGGVSNKELRTGEGIKIMTGAPIPLGANAVIKKEDIRIDQNKIIINKRIKEGENICLKGEDIAKDTKLVSKRQKLDYANIGILASAGISEVKVYESPNIAFISTGDEVIDVGNKLSKGQIYNSNKYSILARLKELGYKVTYIEHINDNEKNIGEKIIKGSKVADIIITTGGASVGDKDLIKEAIDKANGKRIFWKVKIKPGSAMLFSKINNVPIISLSGNPTAALTTFELLVRTALQKLSGEKKVEIVREKAVLMNDFLKKSPQRRFLRGMVTTRRSWSEVYITQIKSGNGILSSTLNSNCLIDIEKDNVGLEKDSIVNIIRF